MDVTKMEFYKCSMDKVLFSAFGILFFAGVAAGGESCTFTQSGKSGTVYCEYGCCGTLNKRECCSYSVSTSVLIVAGVVGGLVFIALVSAIIVCCVKKYKDKQALRVRELHHRQRNAHVVHVRRGPATVPKPPTYTAAPPAYSSEMPESHFRPITVNGNYVPYNQRFNTPHPPTTTPRTVSGSGTGNPPLQSSNQSFQTSTVRSRPQVFVTAVPQAAAAARNPAFAARQDPPPPYREFERGRTPANRRRRFIQSPGGDTTDATAVGTSIDNVRNTHPNVPLQRVPSRTETSPAAPDGGVAAPPVVARISRIPTRTQNMTPSSNSSSDPATNTSSNVTTSVTTTSQRSSATTSQNSANIPATTHVAAPSLSTGNTARQLATGAPSNTAVAAAHNTTSSPIATTSQSPDDQQRDRAPSRTLALLHARIASRRNNPGNIRNIREENIQDIDDLACL